MQMLKELITGIDQKLERSATFHMNISESSVTDALRAAGTRVTYI